MNNGFFVGIILIVLIVSLSGCTQQQNQPTPETSKTCSQLGGYACKETEQCFGKNLSASDVQNCCSVVCTQKSTQTENTTKSCAEQNGTICKSGEKCEGTTLKAGDTTSCCSANCTKIEAAQEKGLEEMNLKKEDFPAGFVLNDTVSGYQKNALEYKDGNQEAANELLAHGWQENYAVDFVKRSETQEIMGTKIILEDYFASLSRYDKAKDYPKFFKEFIAADKKGFEDVNATILAQSFGDNSIFAKSTTTNEYTGLTTINYELYFTKNNVFVNFMAAGQSRQINDEKVIEYARKIESRIGN